MAKRSSSKTEDVAAGGLPLGPKCRMVMLIGKDLFVRAESTRLLRVALEKEHGEVDTVVFDGPSTTAAEILDECRSFGLIARHKLILVEDAEGVVKEDSRPAFERYAQAPCDSATLVFRSEKLIPGNLGKAVERVGCIISCTPPTPQEAVKWVLSECKKRHAIDIEPAAAELMVENIGPIQAQLDTELAKLAVAADTATIINRALVEQFVGKTREEDIWSIQTTVLKASNAARIGAIRYTINTLRTPGTLVLFALTDLSRKLHVISRGTKAGANPGVIRRVAKLWGASADDVFAAGAGLEWRRSVGLFRACVEADRRSKSGLGDAARSSEIASLRFPRPGGASAPQRR
jgi:DNA polymerase III delta subunit